MGEVSKLALARVDLEKMRLSAECQVNWLPTVLGPMMLRPGTKHLASTRSDAAAKFLPFVFSNSDTALIELTDQHMRVWVNDAVLTAASVSTSITSGTFSASASWTLTATSGASSTINTSAGRLELHARALGSSAYAEQNVTIAGGDQNAAHRLRIVILRGPVTFQIGSSSGGEQYFSRTTLGTGTHSIAFTPTGGNAYVRFTTTTKTTKWVDSITVESSGAVDLPTPWTASDLAYVRRAQSGDIVYVACDGFQPRQIERRDNNSWSIVLYENLGGPFVEPPEWARQIVMDPTLDVGGTQTVDCSAVFFNNNQVEMLLRMRINGQVRAEEVAGASQWTKPIRVTGITSSDRTFSWTVSGTWVGTLTLQRSLDGPDFGFTDLATVTANGTNSQDDSSVYSNNIAWYRVGFDDGDYTSGNPKILFQSSGSDTGDGSKSGFVRIKAINGVTQVEVEIVETPASSTGTTDWQIGEWSDDNVWPSAVALFDGRLWWAARDQIWGSVSNDYTNFDDETEGDSGPLQRSIGQGPIANINFLLPLSRLIVGCDGSEVSVRSSAFDEPLTPTNFTVKECSTQGSASLPALKLDTRGVFVEKSGRRVYELAYDIQIQDYRARDLTYFAPDISNGATFTALAVQRQPETVLHFARADGEVAILVQSPEDQVECWWRFQTLGVVEDIVVLPGTQEDSVYYVVKRTINGSTKRFLEKFALRSQCVGGSLNRNLDCHLVVSQASSTTISGLSHLEGETVYVWANGKDLGSYTVASASITVSEAVTSAIVGLGGVSFSYDDSTAATSVTCATKYNGYPAEIFATGPNGGELRYVGTVTVSGGVATLPNGRSAKKIRAYLGLYGLFRSSKLAYGAQLGTALTQIKKIEKMGVIAFDTHYQGLSYGPSVDNLQPLPLVEGGVDTAADTVWPEFDRPMIGLSGSWDTDSRLHLVALAPKPVTVAGAVVAVNTSEAR